MNRYIIGIDEVGRGSLAGPVVVCAVAVLARWLPAHPSAMTRHSDKEGAAALRDSKKLSPKQREEWFRYFSSHSKIAYAIARVYPRRIEKMNISKAANLAAFRAFLRLTKTYNLKPNTSVVYLDGGLYLGNQGRGFSQIKTRINADRIRAHLPDHPRVSATTVVRGDEKIKAVMIASIIAKVHRDRLMTRLGRKYPKYGFEVHKGYGTRRHRLALARHGPSAAHRTTFIS